jgi:hypothetical protein
LAVRVLILALAIAAAPMPSLAGETSPTAPTAKAAPVLKDAIAKAAANEPVAKARAQGGDKVDKSELGSKSFFKKPAGIIAMIVVAAGTGYAFYSSRHDRIHSVVRAGQ